MSEAIAIPETPSVTPLQREVQMLSPLDRFIADAHEAALRCTCSFRDCEIRNGDGLTIMRRMPELHTEIEAHLVPLLDSCSVQVNLNRRTEGRVSVTGGFNVPISGQLHQASCIISEVTTFFSQQTQAACLKASVPCGS